MAPSLHSHQPRVIGGTSDARDVTGPIDVVSVSNIEVALRKGCHCVAIDGGLDLELAARVAETLAGSLDAPIGVIIDLDNATLLDPEAVEVLVAAVETTHPGTPLCFSASRLSARLVLGRWGIADTIATFASVADALQTKLLADDGYGDGWTVASPDRA